MDSLSQWVLMVGVGAAAGRLRRGVVVGAVALLVGLAVFTWLRIAYMLTNVRPVAVPTAPAPRAIVWGDRVFANRRSLARWLRSHGESFGGWAAVHPAAVSIIAPQRRSLGPVSTQTRRAKQQPSRALASATRRQHAAVTSAGVYLFVAALVALLLVAPLVWRKARRLRPLQMHLPRAATPSIAPAFALLGERVDVQTALYVAAVVTGGVVVGAVVALLA